MRTGEHMFRVKLNLWTDTHDRNESSDVDKALLGDWHEEQQRVDACVTREEVYAIFRDKFKASQQEKPKTVA
ncbi:hypothetical protein EDD53_2728 [Pacificibacter maritimus]|uniref:Uncharacterized protein n=1 Tax=Pacificibacter maritimus TaxID=762213 RepID=A0A3N4U7P3_9RHOB|nr:hypothetical protein EDD53_2728 [Pacificibacter maritimus]